MLEEALPFHIKHVMEEQGAGDVCVSVSLLHHLLSPFPNSRVLSVLDLDVDFRMTGFSF